MKIMDLGEFVREGYLQDVNRLYFHPIGLSLQTTKRHKGLEVVDYLDNPTALNTVDLKHPKSRKVHDMMEHTWFARREAYMKALGWTVQVPLHG